MTTHFSCNGFNRMNRSRLVPEDWNWITIFLGKMGPTSKERHASSWEWKVCRSTTFCSVTVQNDWAHRCCCFCHLREEMDGIGSWLSFKFVYLPEFVIFPPMAPMATHIDYIGSIRSRLVRSNQSCGQRPTTIERYSNRSCEGWIDSPMIYRRN